jgi:signal transduction histidine kinase/tetratricopeptide (TPR) repeat protein/ActR/RegA family two-component response regulator
MVDVDSSALNSTEISGNGTEFRHETLRLMNLSFDDARMKAREYLQIALDSEDSVLINDALFNMGHMYVMMKRNDSASVFLNMARKGLQQSGDKVQLSNVLRAQGTIYLYTGNNSEALELYNRSLELALDEGDSLSIARALNNIGQAQFESGEYEESLEQLSKSLSIKKRISERELISTLVNIGNNHFALQNFAEAYQNLTKAEEIARKFQQNYCLAEILKHKGTLLTSLDSFNLAVSAFEESINLKEKMNDKLGLADVLVEYGNMWEDREKWLMAEKYYLEAYNVVDRRSDPDFFHRVCFHLGHLNYSRKNNIEAEKWLIRAIETRDLKDETALAQSYELLSKTNYLNNDYSSAYHHLKISKVMSDSLFLRETDKRMREMQLKFENENNRKTITSLREINRIKEEEQQKSNVYFIVSFALFIVTLIIAVALARQVELNERKSKELKQQFDENISKTEALIKSKSETEEALRVKSDFIAAVSHEIRTPMNAIIGMSNLLEDTQLTPDQKNYLNSISLSSSNMLILLNDILDFSNIEEGRMTLEYGKADLAKLLSEIESVCRPPANDKSLDFRMELDDLPRWVYTDAPRLRQVILNLLNNAVKFTHEGSITFRVGVLGKEKTLNGFKYKLVFSVIDTGIGIPEDKQRQIFEAFRQIDSSISRKYAGIGIGLSISQGILTKMGSTLEVESEFANGSTFQFILDLKAEEPIKQEAKAEKAEEPKVLFDKEMGVKFPMSILIAEDNLVNQKLLQMNLNKMGYAPTVVSNGQEALDRLETNSFDLIFMDIQMPVMDGLTATKEIIRKYTYKERPVIVAVTADAMGNSKVAYITQGMDDYISKPFLPEQIESCLKYWHEHTYSEKKGEDIS